jgi:TonB family protein
MHQVETDFVRPPGNLDDKSSHVTVPTVLLPNEPSRWRSFGTGLLLEFLIMIILLSVPILFPDKFDPVRRFVVTALSRSESHPRKAQSKRSIITARPNTVWLPSDQNVEAVPEHPVHVPVDRDVAKPVNARRTESSQTLPEIASIVSKETVIPIPVPGIPSLTKPRDEVRTGMFAENDQSGVPAIRNSGHRAEVVNAKFSDGSAKGMPGGTSRHTADRGFSDSTVARYEPNAEEQIRPLTTETPVKVLAKPKPAYTVEARDKKIEGDVVLKVIFSASGNVQVLNIVKGLGFGLDESAVNAAKQIQFQAAKQGGRPIDVAATVHITFMLAE